MLGQQQSVHISRLKATGVTTSIRAQAYRCAFHRPSSMQAPMHAERESVICHCSAWRSDMLSLWCLGCGTPVVSQVWHQYASSSNAYPGALWLRSGAVLQMVHTQYQQPYSEVDGLASLLKYPVQNAGGCKVCSAMPVRAYLSHHAKKASMYSCTGCNLTFGCAYAVRRQRCQEWLLAMAVCGELAPKVPFVPRVDVCRSSYIQGGAATSTQPHSLQWHHTMPCRRPSTRWMQLRDRTVLRLKYCCEHFLVVSVRASDTEA